MRKRTPPTPSPVPLVAPPQLLSIPEVAHSLRIGRTKVYSLIKTEGLPAVQVGSTLRVSVGDLQNWVEQHTRASLVG